MLARLAISKPDTAADVYDAASVRLPDSIPNVIATRIVPDTPPDPMHATDVSDTHSLASHPDTPIRPPAVYPADPSPPPLTVTDTLPVLTRFVRIPTDADGPSYDITSVPLPTSPPAVTISRTVPPAPCAPMHLTDVSDTHSLASHPEAPILAPPLYLASP